MLSWAAIWYAPPDRNLTLRQWLLMEDSYTYKELPDPDPPSLELDETKRRLGSLDAYRGLAMFLMVAEALHLCRVAKNFPGNEIWEALCFHQSHEAWVGCSIHDMIQPSFSFMVGVALPFSIARRRATGQSMGWVTAHAFWRAAVLVFLGIFLRSLGQDQTAFRFDDTLTQIGLGYGFLFLLGLVFDACPVDLADGEYWSVGGRRLRCIRCRSPESDFDFESVGCAERLAPFDERI